MPLECAANWGSTFASKWLPNGSQMAPNTQIKCLNVIFWSQMEPKVPKRWTNGGQMVPKGMWNPLCLCQTVRQRAVWHKTIVFSCKAMKDSLMLNLVLGRGRVPMKHTNITGMIKIIHKMLCRKMIKPLGPRYRLAGVMAPSCKLADAPHTGP